VVKQIAHKIFSLSLALLVLFSTVSLTVEKHYCGSVLIDVSIFTEGQKCAMEAFEIEQEAITKKKCCKDVVEIVEGQDELQIKDFNDIETHLQWFVTSFVYSYETLYTSLPKQIIPHKDYSPPNLVYDIQLLDDVFLI
jgi:hypothetical protein